MFSDDFFVEDQKREAIELFKRAYEAQQSNDYEEAIALYKRSIARYPTAEAHTFLGWVYSFQSRYDEAIEECLEAIRLDETFSINSGIPGVANVPANQFPNPFYGAGTIFQFPSSLRLGIKFQF